MELKNAIKLIFRKINYLITEYPAQSIFGFGFIFGFLFGKIF